jgi:hypothetical protein
MPEATSPLFYVTTPNGRLRTITLVYGLLLFVWLTPEDNTVWPVALLGIGLALLSVVWFVRRRLGGSAFPARYVPISAALLGGIVGLGGALSSAGFMFFKNALHAHAFWDYPPAIVGAMLSRAPSWAVAGALAGFGLGCLWVWYQTIVIVKQKDA